MARSCRGVRQAGNCGCDGYAYERMLGAYETCFCGHAKGTHILGEVKAKVDPITTDHIPLIEKKSNKVSISTPSVTLTPAEARAKLRAAGHQVGQRGRLSPDQMALAATL